MRKFFITIWLAIIGVVSGAAWVTWQNFIHEPISEKPDAIVFEVPKGANAKQIANLLYQQGYLPKPQLFVWYLRYQEKHHLLKAGEFAIQPNLTVDELVDILINGETVSYEATIIAGHTFKQTLQQLQSLPKLKKELDIDDISALQEAFEIKRAINKKYPYANLEGQFLPETYYYHAGDSDKMLLLRAHQALLAVLDKAWQNRQKKLPFKSAEEALILASIVEKETGYAPERAEIAGVFVNRLRRGMRLQTDPTVIYGIGQSYDGNIRKRDLNTKTAYNTYQMSGLPPTPIANPSREAIEATLQPNKTKALYFVAKGGGQHEFSTNLQAHNRAVRKYILNK